MAWTFSEQIHAITGFDAASNSDSATGEDFRVLSAQWLTDASREVINILPTKLKEKCMTETTLNNSSPTADLDTLGGEVLYVNRLSANSGGSRIPCRQVSLAHAELASDSSSIYYASVTDPVYWISSSSDASILSVLPTPESTQTAIVYHVGYPSIAYGDTSIANFPDEAEYLVPLRAAITAAEYLLAIEEDAELYMPMLSVLKAQYQEGILALQTGSFIPQQQGKK
jgi:hypothetical protein